MRLLCIGRHAFLSDHLSRYFRELGGQCEPVVGVTTAPDRARAFEPHLVVVESDLLTPAVLDVWSHDPALHEVPVLAVSLTHRPEECASVELSGLAGVIYLPSLGRGDAISLLRAACPPRGVDLPLDADLLLGADQPVRWPTAVQY